MVYIPHSFKVEDEKELFAFCKQHSFGTVISNSSTGAPELTQIPFTLKTDENGNWIIEFHLAKANKQHLQFGENAVCGLLISGAHGYISSSVYGHENVPTYNYESVYLSCKSTALSKTELEVHLAELTQHFEEDREKPLRYRDFNRSMVAEYLEEIVGIRLNVFEKQGAFKLSQNRNKEDFQSILNDNKTNTTLCKAMLKHYPND